MPVPIIARRAAGEIPRPPDDASLAGIADRLLISVAAQGRWWLAALGCASAAGAVCSLLMPAALAHLLDALLAVRPGGTAGHGGTVDAPARRPRRACRRRHRPAGGGSARATLNTLSVGMGGSMVNLNVALDAAAGRRADRRPARSASRPCRTGSAGTARMSTRPAP